MSRQKSAPPFAVFALPMAIDFRRFEALSTCAFPPAVVEDGFAFGSKTFVSTTSFEAPVGAENAVLNTPSNIFKLFDK